MNIIYVPCKNKKEAQKIARHLVSNKFAICINIIHPVDSIYLWKGKVAESYESLLLIKTSEKLVDDVITQIKKLHSYNLPDIISWKIDRTILEVEEWFKKEMK